MAEKKMGGQEKIILQYVINNHLLWKCSEVKTNIN